MLNGHRVPTRTLPAAWAAAAAYAAGILGLLYAGVSAYWGAGGTGLRETIGGGLEREGRAGTTGVLVIVWITVALKLAASTIGVLAVVPPRGLSGRTYTWVRRGAWLAALVLTVYGGVLTLIGLLVQADVVHRSATADQTALRWHAFLWDPWFLLWGLLLATALTLSRRRAPEPG